jgi:long-subunit acyl-CoA synthetase (AMP-forming)
MPRTQGPIEQLIRHRASNGLLTLGVKPRERVAIVTGNRPEFMSIRIAIERPRRGVS